MNCSNKTQLVFLHLIVMCALKGMLQHTVLSLSEEGSIVIPCPCSVSFSSEKKQIIYIQYLSHLPAGLEILLQNTCGVTCVLVLRRKYKIIVSKLDFDQGS